ncbi:MAG: hypothetical protein ACLUHH_05330 [Christensenellales bacterium]
MKYEQTIQVRNFFEQAVIRQADRLYPIKNPTDEQLCTLILGDVKE